MLISPTMAVAAERLDVAIELPEQAEATPFGFSDRPDLRMVGRPVPGAPPPDEVGPYAEGGPLEFRCAIREGRLEVQIRAVMARYPKRLPEELQCAIGGFDVHVALAPIRTLYPDPADLVVDLARGVEVRRHPPAPGERGESTVTFALPGAGWAAQETPGRREGPGSWRDLRCRVEVRAGRPLLLVRQTSETSTGAGTCRLVDGEGVAHRVPVALVEVPKAPIGR